MNGCSVKKNRFQNLKKSKIEKMIAGYSDKSPSVFDNTENEPMTENSNFPLISTCVVLVITFVVVGMVFCCCRYVIREPCSSPEEGIQTKPERDSNLAQTEPQTDFDLPPAYSKVVELPNSNAMFIYS